MYLIIYDVCLYYAAVWYCTLHRLSKVQQAIAQVRGHGAVGNSSDMVSSGGVGYRSSKGSWCCGLYWPRPHICTEVELTLNFPPMQLSHEHMLNRGKGY